jgi:hypothetical protein
VGGQGQQGHAPRQANRPSSPTTSTRPTDCSGPPGRGTPTRPRASRAGDRVRHRHRHGRWDCADLGARSAFRPRSAGWWGCGRCPIAPSTRPTAWDTLVSTCGPIAHGRRRGVMLSVMAGVDDRAPNSLPVCIDYVRAGGAGADQGGRSPTRRSGRRGASGPGWWRSRAAAKQFGRSAAVDRPAPTCPRLARRLGDAPFGMIGRYTDYLSPRGTR